MIMSGIMLIPVTSMRLLTAGQETEKVFIKTAIFLNNMFPQINDYLPHTAPKV